MLRLALLLLLAPPAPLPSPDELARTARWEMATHGALLGSMDALLDCAVRHPAPRWAHLRLRVTAEGRREALRDEDLFGLSAPEPSLRRCMDAALPVELPPPGVPRTTLRTLFYRTGLAEDGAPGPQQLRVPLQLGGAPDAGVAGLELDLGAPPAADAPAPTRLPKTVFVDSPAAARTDLARRFWMQGLRDAVDLRSEALRACLGDRLLQITVEPDGAVHSALCPEILLGLRLPPSPDGQPGRLAAAWTPAGYRRADWPGEGDLVLSEADEAMALASADRANREVGDCYAQALNRPFSRRPEGELQVGVVLGSAGEVGEVLLAGELAEEPFARCVAAAHQRYGLPAPLDGTPVVVLLRYAFAPP